MVALKIATKANQAFTLPALLVARFAKEQNRNVFIDVHFEDVDTLKPNENALIELHQESKSSTSGSQEVINELISTFSLCQGKNEKIVSYVRSCVDHVN